METSGSSNLEPSRFDVLVEIQILKYLECLECLDGQVRRVSSESNGAING